MSEHERKTETPPPMTRRVVEGLSDRNLHHRDTGLRLLLSEREAELGRHLAKIIGRSRSGSHFLMRPELAALLGVEAAPLSYSVRQDMMRSNNARGLGALATPAAVFEGVGEYLEDRGISPGEDDRALATDVAVGIRFSLMTNDAPEADSYSRPMALSASGSEVV